MTEVASVEVATGALVTAPAVTAGGSGEKNYVTSPNAKGTVWVASGAGVTVTDTSTASECPRALTTRTAIKLTAVSGTDYARYRWTLDDVDVGNPMHAKFPMRVIGALATGDFKVEVYYTTDSTYATGLTEQALSTDVSGTSSIAALDHTYVTNWTPASDALYWEIRLVRVAGTAAFGFSDVVIGPGTSATSSGASSPVAWTPTGSFLSNVTYAGHYWRTGNRLGGKVRVDFSSSTTSTGFTLNLPTGLTIDTTNLGAGYPYMVGDFIIVDSSTSDRYTGRVAFSTSSPSVLTLYYDAQGANTDTTINRALTQLSNSAPIGTLAAGDYISINFDNVPIVEWAGGAIAVIQDQNLTEWASYTPTSSFTTNSNTPTGRWRRVGDTMEVQFRQSFSGAPDATTYTISLPSGYNIDTSKLPNNSAGDNTLGVASAEDGSAIHTGSVKQHSTNTAVRCYGSDGDGAWTNTVPFTFGSGDVISGKFAVPILEWANRSGGGALGYGLATPDAAGMVRPGNSVSGTTQLAYDATQTIRTGTYTPTMVEIANLDSNPTPVANSMSWMQVGRMVHCFGYITIDATNGTTASPISTSWTCTLPVLPVSNFTVEHECAGQFTCQPTSDVAFTSGYVRATTSGAKTAHFEFGSTNNVIGRAVTYSFTYKLF